MGLSICIPTYNRISSLKLLLNSILKGFRAYPFEIIIVDGGSTDGTIEYLEKLRLNNLRIIKQKKLDGSVKAYNDAFKVARYKYVFWPADDFILVPEVLIKSCRLMDRFEEIGLVAPKMKEPTYGGIHGVELSNDFLVLSKTHIFRKSVLEKINYFDEKFRTYAVDDDSCLSVLNLGYTIIFTKEVGVIHNRIQDSLWVLNNRSQIRKEEYEYFVEKWKPLKLKLSQYLNSSKLKKNESKVARFLCRAIFGSRVTKFLPRNFKEGIIKVYDKLLEKVALFKTDLCSELNDFYLAQKLPKEILD